MKESTKLWVKAALIRALKTFCESFASCITVGQLITDINWAQALSISIVATIYCLFIAVKGLPEAPLIPAESEGE